jgi:hypothetical protein
VLFKQPNAGCARVFDAHALDLRTTICIAAVVVVVVVVFVAQGDGGDVLAVEAITIKSSSVSVRAKSLHSLPARPHPPHPPHPHLQYHQHMGATRCV